MFTIALKKSMKNKTELKMSKKETLEPKPLPFTNAETAEQRLEELVRNKSIRNFRIMSSNESHNLWPLEGECRVYPDGFEGVNITDDKGVYLGSLYLDRRRAYVVYYWEKDYEKQNEVKDE